MIDLPKIDELIEWAEGEQEKKDRGERSEWDQGTWGRVDSCGTACCIAGRLAITEPGVDPFIYDYQWRDFTDYRSGKTAFVSPGVVRRESAYLGVVEWSAVLVNSEPEDMGSWARKRLGIHPCTGDEEDLFDSENNLSDLKRIRDDLAEDVGVATKWR